MSFFAHETAIVSPNAKIGEGTKIWHFAHVREDAQIGKNCIIGQGVYIDSTVQIGDNCKIQNNASVFHGVTVEDGVFIGPHVCFTNDKYPRAIDEDGNVKGADGWIVSETLVKKGASIGANATILPGVTIGEFAMIGSGSLVSRDVPDFGLAIGNPAKLVGTVGKDGKITKRIQVTS